MTENPHRTTVKITTADAVILRAVAYEAGLESPHQYGVGDLSALLRTLAAALADPAHRAQLIAVLQEVRHDL